jgi:hypothetical protein
LALFNLVINSKLRGCDLVKLKVKDVAHGDQALKRAMVMHQKTHQPVQFEFTEQTRTSVSDWIKQAKLKSEDFLFPSRIHNSPHITTRQYARKTSSPRGASENKTPARAFSGQWLNETRSAILAVPSVIARLDQNALVNPLHPDANKLIVPEPKKVIWDKRFFQ